MNSSEIADVIERAVDILESERKEWCQGDYYRMSTNPDGTDKVLSVCALGAVRLALVEEQEDRLWTFGQIDARGVPERQKEHVVFNALLMNLPPPDVDVDGWTAEWDGIHDYNDYPGRTKEEVIEVMKATAKDLRNANHTVL